MCEEVLFMEANGVQTKEHGKKLCVTNNCSWSSWNNFHEQASKLFTKMVVLISSNVGFVSNFK
jgi:hypothetical protein